MIVVVHRDDDAKKRLISGTSQDPIMMSGGGAAPARHAPRQTDVVSSGHPTSRLQPAFVVHLELGVDPRAWGDR